MRQRASKRRRRSSRADSSFWKIAAHGSSGLAASVFIVSGCAVLVCMRFAALHTRARTRAHAHARLWTAAVSFDIDCLDPAHAPGTGTPEPGTTARTTARRTALNEARARALGVAGGLSSAAVLTLLEELSELNFVG